MSEPLITKCTLTDLFYSLNAQKEGRERNGQKQEHRGGEAEHVTERKREEEEEKRNAMKRERERASPGCGLTYGAIFSLSSFPPSLYRRVCTHREGCLHEREYR